MVWNQHPGSKRKKTWMKNATCRSSTRSLQKAKRIYHGPKLGATNLEAGLPILVLWPHFWVQNLAPVLGPQNTNKNTNRSYSIRAASVLLPPQADSNTYPWYCIYTVFIYTYIYIYIYIHSYIYIMYNILLIIIISYYLIHLWFPPKLQPPDSPSSSPPVRRTWNPSAPLRAPNSSPPSGSARPTAGAPTGCRSPRGRCRGAPCCGRSTWNTFKKRATVVHTQSLGIGYGIWNTQKNCGDVMLKWWFNH